VIGLGFNVTKTVDWAILPYKEITITGTMMHGLENYKGKKCDAFDIALEIFAENPDFYKNLVTNKFSLENYKEAFKTIEEKEKYQTIKTVFDF
ncbi:MAG: hypothetical protein U9O98_00495, partial [Asgard group archaeon]|nr:hypothetical protein [Asgard group archaeon]